MTEDRPWIKWAWRHYVLEMDTYATLDEAIRAASYAYDDGEESLHSIEGPDGVVDDEVVRQRMHALSDQRSAEWKAREAADPRPFAIKLAAPDSKGVAWFATYPTEAERDAAAVDLRQRFGDRVKVGTNPWDALA